MRNINRFGEIYYEKNQAIVTMPFSRLTKDEPGLLEESYIDKVKEMDYPDVFIYADHFSSIRDRLQMDYDLDGCVDFHQIHKYKLRDMIPFLYSMVEIARQDAKILWQKQNMVIDLNERRVKALLFGFDGFTIYKKDNSVDGLKELILLSLTNKDGIIAKPKRADFIEKTDEVYQFSNDILASNSVDDIENAISAYERQVQYEDMKSEQEKQEKRANSKFFAIKEKMKPKKKEKNPDEQMKETLRQQASTKEDKNKPSSGGFLDKITTPKSMLSIIAVVFIVGILLTQTNFVTGASSDEDDLKSKMSQKNEVLEAYRLYVNGGEDNIKRAYAKLDAIGYSNLPQDDQATLIDWYIEQDQYNKAITLAPDSDIDVDNDIFNKNEDNKDAIKSELETLEKSFPENDVIKFDLASLDDNYQGMAENSHLTRYDDKRARLVVKSHILINELDQLDELMDEYKNKEGYEDSLEALQDQYDKYYDKYSEQLDARENKEKLESDLGDKKSDLENEDDKDKKKDLKQDIKDLESDIDDAEDKINKSEDSIKNDDEM